MKHRALLVFLMVGMYWGKVGVAVEPSAHCERIVSISPSTTNILADMGLVDHIVGATPYCQLPKNHKAQNVGGFIDYSLERIFSLKPSIVFIQKQNDPRDIARMEKLNISVNTINLSSLAYILKSYQQIEAICQVNTLINIDEIISDLDRIKERLSHVKSKKILLFYVHNDHYQNFLPERAMGKSFHSELLTYIGLENAYQGELNAPILSPEAIHHLNPDKMIFLRASSEEDFDHRYHLTTKKVTLNWPFLAKLGALKNGEVYEVHGAASVLASPLAIKAVANALEEIMLAH